MKSINLFLIIFATLIQSCKIKKIQFVQDTIQSELLPLDSLEFKIVSGGDYRDCIQDVWETPWTPERGVFMENSIQKSAFIADSIQWFKARGLLDSVEIVLAHATIFKGILKDFYHPEYDGNIYSLVYHATYYNQSHEVLPVLGIINYSRRGYQEVFLRQGAQLREKITICNYFPIENRLSIFYNRVFSEWLERQPKNYIKRAKTNVNR